MGIAFAVALVVQLGIPTPEGLSRTLGTLAACYFPLLLTGRFVFRAVTTLPRFSRRVVVLGLSDLGMAVADAIVARGNVGIEFVGFLAEEDQEPEGSVGAYPVLGGYPVLGWAHHLEKVVDSAKVDMIIVAPKQRTEDFPSGQLVQAKLRGVQVESAVSFYERLTGRIYTRGLEPSYLIFSEGFTSSRVAEGVHRAADIAVSALALVISAPALAVCAVAIRLDSRGPVFFRQQRVGKGGRTFEVLKLRTMREDAEKETGPAFASLRDPRVTRVGHILRMTRLDEAPQYWNVLLGDMSITGPRPERPEFMDLLVSRHPLFRLRLTQKPGLTGWAQVRHGYVSDIEEFESKLGLDLYYLKHRSLLFDLLIVLQTFKTVILFRGL
jgi:exopolysaccharide biosynthesis polyprenyl glycosylphosphotransferase